MATAGTITVDFAAETARFRAELERVNERLRRIEGGYKRIEDFGKKLFAGASVGVAGAFIKSSADAADALGKTADRLGIASERLTVFQLAAKNTGLEVETANTLLKEAQKRLGEASTGQGEAAKTMKALGLQYKDLKNLQPDELFLAYGDAIAKLGTKQEQAAAAADLFGKQGSEALNFILQGRGAIDEATEFVNRYGLALSRVEIGQIEAANDSIGNLANIAQGAGQRIAVGLSPFVQAFTDALGEATGSTTILQDAVSVLGGAGYGALQLFANAARVLQAAFFGVAAAVSQALSFVTFGDVSESLKAAAQANLLKADAALQNVKSLGQIQEGLAAIYDNSRQRAEEAVAKAQAAAALGNATLSDQFGGDTEFLSEQEKNQQLLDLDAAFNAARVEAAQAVSSELARIQGEQVYVHGDVNQLILEDQQRAEEANLALRQQGFDGATSLLAAFAQKSKTAAKLQVAVDKARALAQAILNTKAGITLQLTSGDPYTAVPRAIAAGVFGALQIAAIVKTGFNESGSIDANGGRAPIGSPTNPVFTERPENAPGNVGSLGTPAQERGSVQIIVQGNLFTGRETVNYLLDRFREEINDKDVVLISNTSQQARELTA